MRQLFLSFDGRIRTKDTRRPPHASPWWSRIISCRVAEPWIGFWVSAFPEKHLLLRFFPSQNLPLFLSFLYISAVRRIAYVSNVDVQFSISIANSFSFSTHSFLFFFRYRSIVHLFVVSTNLRLFFRSRTFVSTSVFTFPFFCDGSTDENLLAWCLLEPTVLRLTLDLASDLCISLALQLRFFASLVGPTSVCIQIELVYSCSSGLSTLSAHSKYPLYPLSLKIRCQLQFLLLQRASYRGQVARNYIATEHAGESGANILYILPVFIVPWRLNNRSEQGTFTGKEESGRRIRLNSGKIVYGSSEAGLRAFYAACFSFGHVRYSLVLPLFAACVRPVVPRFQAFQRDEKTRRLRQRVRDEDARDIYVASFRP